MPSIYHRLNPELEAYRAQSLEIAQDLGYPTETFDQIREAKTEMEISRALTAARNSDKRDYRRRKSYYG